MEAGNILAKNITTAGDKAAYDAACKRLLANKIILAWIMKSCLEEYRDLGIGEIAEKYIEGSPQMAKAAVNSDEIADTDGEQIKLRAQNENYDLLTAVMICLGHSGDDKYIGILKLLDVLLSSEKEPEEKKKILQDDFDIKMTRELESEVSELCNLSKGIKEKGIAIGMEREREAGALRVIEFNGYAETDGGTGNGGIKSPGNGTPEICRQIEEIKNWMNGS